MENETAPPPAAPPQHSSPFFDSIRRMGVRRADDRWLGGVASGLAERLGVDPLIVRGVLVITVFLSGAGIVLYGLAWAFLPEARDGRIHVEQAFRGDVDVALIGAGGFVVLGLARGDGWWLNAVGLGWLNGLLWLAAIGLVVFLAVRSGRDSTPTGPDHSWTDGPGTGSGTWDATDHWTTGPTSSVAPTMALPSKAPTTPIDTETGTAPGENPDDDPHAAREAQRAAAARARAEADHARTEARRARTAASAERARYADERAAQRRAVQAAAAARRPRAAGPTVVGATLGLILLLGAGLLAADRAGVTNVPLLLTWVSTAALVTGVVTVAVGIAGRRSGGLMGVAVGLLLTVPVAATLDALRLPDEAGIQRYVADGTYTFDSAADAADGAAFTVGDATIDLRDIDPLPQDFTVPVSQSLGDITVLLPEGASAAANVDLWAGEVRWIDADGWQTSYTAVGPDTIRVGDDTPDPDITLDIDALAGTVTIVEES